MPHPNDFIYQPKRQPLPMDIAIKKVSEQLDAIDKRLERIERYIFMGAAPYQQPPRKA